jgi:hypothetical protein
MLNVESSMFSGSEKSRRTPPEARGVEARAYVGSRSTTVTSVEGSSSRRK